MIQRQWFILVCKQRRAFLEDKPHELPLFFPHGRIWGKIGWGIRCGVGRRKELWVLTP